MARIRTIKPEFWSDEKVGLCSPTARLLFLGLLNFCDDYGNLVRAPRQLKAQIFPYDVLEVEPLLLELEAQRLAVEYMVDGARYLNIPRFSKHQIVNRKSAPQCPAPPTQRALSEPSVSTIARCMSPLAEGRKEGGKEGMDKERPVKSGDNSTAVQHVGDLLKIKPGGSA